MLLLQQMIVLFIYMIIGYGAAKKSIFDEGFSKKISWLVVNVANPAMVLSSVVNGEGSIRGKDLMLTARIAVVMFGVLLLTARIVPIIFRVEKEDKNIYKVLTVFNNIGFMGYPVIAAAYGNEALLYAAVFCMVFNILIYSYGTQTIQGTAGKGIQWKKMFNVGVISCVAAVVLYLGNIPMSQFVKSAVSGLSSLTGPLSMMVIGISLSGIRLRELVMDIRLLLYSLVKLVVMPVAGMMIINSFVDNEMLCGVCMIMLATPAASMVVMLAQQYGKNSELASKGVALTTVLSVVTIPLVSAIVF